LFYLTQNTMKILFSICLTFILFISCKQEDKTLTIAQPDCFVFGHFYGKCMGEQCVEIYKLEDNKLFEDTKDKYPNRIDFYAGNYVQLSNQKWLNTNDLMRSFPADLLNETDTVIGQPDAGDWGGLYVEYNFNGVRRFWILDQMKSNVPTKYHDFIDIVNQKISFLE